jgi:2-oxoglutarate ferredoxin oxidoreductase subunit gamma
MPGGLLVINGSLIEALPSRSDIEIVAVPCTALAKTAGDDRLVSVVALGALLARRPLVGLAAVREAITAAVQGKRPEILAADLAALEAGYAAGLEGAAALEGAASA